MVDRLIKGVDTCQKLGAYLSALCMLAIVALIIVEIVCRTFFNVSTLIADEFSGYLMVAAVMSGLGFTLQSGSHIRITLLSERLSPNVKRWFELATTLIAAAITFFALYHAVLMVEDTFAYDMRADSISETALYIPQLLIPLGLLGLALQLIAHFVTRLRSCSPTP